MNKDLIGLEGLSRDEILAFIETAKGLKEVSRRDIKKVPTLRGKTVVNLFFESSTRTRTSFEIAAKRLSADTINMPVSSSSVTKGETLIDTIANIESMKPHFIVVRHSSSGAPLTVARHTGASVVNAGDGAHEHPTQGLLDIYTIMEHKQTLEGLKIAIVGDILHSRVARSDLYGFTTLGAKVFFCGPPPMLPHEFAEHGAIVTPDIEEALIGADVVIMLRIQRERQEATNMSTVREYARFYGLNAKKLTLAKRNAIVMHPGPINRGVEISHEIADSPRSVILEQVENGVAVRMAVLYLLAQTT